MYMDRATYNALYNNATDNKFRAVITQKNLLWPGGKVYYRISDDTLDGRLIMDSLEELSKATDRCVTFQRIYGDYSGDFINIANLGEGQCWTIMGRMGGLQMMSLGGEGCMIKATIQHEFMHVLGFYHEHNRPDRDQYLTIKWDKIHKEYCSSFAKCTNCKVITPFNAKSIMQYRTNSFPCDWSDPDIMFEKTANGDKRIPSDRELQPSDVENIKQLYGCKKQQEPTEPPKILTAAKKLVCNWVDVVL